MEILIKITLDNPIQAKSKNKDDDFVSELANGFLWAEISRQEEFINGLIDALNNLEDNDSLEANYLETWIESLKIDLQKEKEKLN
ncbi:MAG: hypothetical protein ACFE8P_12105 [Promethearchaeota archaeon]